MIAETMAKNKPSSIVWCMGQTQHTIGNAMVRAFCILQLALGNIGKIGRRRQHLPRPRQRAGRDRHRSESGFAARLLRHHARCLEALGARSGTSIYEWLKKQYRLRAMMNKPGITVSRWIDGVTGEERTDRPGSEPARR